jgi:hypothetical protein
MLLATCCLLWSCAEEASQPEDRRFANQPSTAPPTNVTASTPSAIVTAPAAPPQASPVSLLNVEGAPRFAFALADDAILVIDTVEPQSVQQIEPPASYRYVAIAQSPAGDQVAALLRPEHVGGRIGYEVVIYNADGSQFERWPNLEVGNPGAATPVSDANGTGVEQASMTWSPQGDRLLLSLGGQDLVGIDIGGQAATIDVPAPVGQVIRAEWSPGGDQVALLAHDRNGAGILWVFAPFVDGVSLRQVAPPNTDAADLGSVTRFGWLPDGSGLAYILSDDAGAEAIGGQLYTVNVRLGVKLLVASPGRGGPAAEIAHFAIAPDGTSIAYTIVAPSEEGWQVHSLWVRSLRLDTIYNIPIGNATHIDRIWWTSAGVAWQHGDGGPPSFQVHVPGGDPVNLVVQPLPATPQASPAMATPVATPERATPLVATSADATPQD